MNTIEPKRDDLRARVDRELIVPALPKTVWHFLSTDDGWSAWWGLGSTIDARPGGAMHIAYPNGQTADGWVLEVEPGRRLVFSFGYDRLGTPLPAGSSIVEIALEDVGNGTRVRLLHLLPDDQQAQHHVAGWRYQLGLFGSLVGRAALGARLSSQADAWHAAWSVTDESARRSALEVVVAPDVRVTEPIAQLSGLDDLDAWIAQVQQQMPASVRRTGPPALCGDLATWDWEVVAGDQRIATGRTVARVKADGRFAEVTGLWLTAPPGIPISIV
jgi:uncharacterized protein YndB with AHSA1/START domain